MEIEIKNVQKPMDLSYDDIKVGEIIDAQINGYPRMFMLRTFDSLVNLKDTNENWQVITGTGEIRKSSIKVYERNVRAKLIIESNCRTN